MIPSNVPLANLHKQFSSKLPDFNLSFNDIQNEWSKQRERATVSPQQYCLDLEQQYNREMFQNFSAEEQSVIPALLAFLQNSSNAEEIIQKIGTQNYFNFLMCAWHLASEKEHANLAQTSNGMNAGVLLEHLQRMAKNKPVLLTQYGKSGVAFVPAELAICFKGEVTSQVANTQPLLKPAELQKTNKMSQVKKSMLSVVALLGLISLATIMKGASTTGNKASSFQAPSQNDTSSFNQTSYQTLSSHNVSVPFTDFAAASHLGLPLDKTSAANDLTPGFESEVANRSLSYNLEVIPRTRVLLPSPENPLEAFNHTAQNDDGVVKIPQPWLVSQALVSCGEATFGMQNSTKNSSSLSAGPDARHPDIDLSNTSVVFERNNETRNDFLIDQMVVRFIERPKSTPLSRTKLPLAQEPFSKALHSSMQNDDGVCEIPKSGYAFQLPTVDETSPDLPVTGLARAPAPSTGFSSPDADLLSFAQTLVFKSTASNSSINTNTSLCSNISEIYSGKKNRITQVVLPTGDDKPSQITTCQFGARVVNDYVLAASKSYSLSNVSHTAFSLLALGVKGVAEFYNAGKTPAAKRSAARNFLVRVGWLSVELAIVTTASQVLKVLWRGQASYNKEDLNTVNLEGMAYVIPTLVATLAPLFKDEGKSRVSKTVRRAAIVASVAPAVILLLNSLVCDPHTLRASVYGGLVSLGTMEILLSVEKSLKAYYAPRYWRVIRQVHLELALHAERAADLLQAQADVQLYIESHVKTAIDVDKPHKDIVDWMEENDEIVREIAQLIAEEMEETRGKTALEDVIKASFDLSEKNESEFMHKMRAELQVILDRREKSLAWIKNELDRKYRKLFLYLDDKLLARLAQEQALKTLTSSTNSLLTAQESEQSLRFRVQQAQQHIDRAIDNQESVFATKRHARIIQPSRLVGLVIELALSYLIYPLAKRLV